MLASSRGLSIRDRLRTVAHFGLGVSVAGQLRENGHVRPCARSLHRSRRHRRTRRGAVLDVPYSVTAHAADIYVSPLLLRTKLAAGDFVTTCTGYNRSHLAEVAPEASGRIVLAYHGLDLERYDPTSRFPSTVPTMLAVGQLREKKGFIHLLHACRDLADRGMAFRCEIIGEGPQRADLERGMQDLGLEHHVAFLGAQSHDEVIDAYRRARLFVLPCVVGDDGDRDGIPNVILEAMAMSLPVVSTRHSGIPEVVEHGATGLLVPPADSTQLADVWSQVLEDPAAGEEMGVQGRAVVLERFDVEHNVRTLWDRFSGDRVAVRGERPVTDATGLPRALADESVFIAGARRRTPTAPGCSRPHSASRSATSTRHDAEGHWPPWSSTRIRWSQPPGTCSADDRRWCSSSTRRASRPWSLRRTPRAHGCVIRGRCPQRRVRLPVVDPAPVAPAASRPPGDHHDRHQRPLRRSAPGPWRPRLRRAGHPHAVRGRALRTGP